MLITSIPSGRCLSGNLPKLALNAGGDVRIRLMDGNKTILDETYTPDFAGNITLDLSELVHDALTFTMPDTDVFVQPALVRTFTLLLNDDAHNFTAIRAGVKELQGTPDMFLMQNFLTAQEQFKQVTADQPEWLTYYAINNVYLYVVAYANGQSIGRFNLASLEHSNAYTINMRFDRLAALCSVPPTFIAVYIVSTDNQRLTPKQYYKRIPDAPDQHFFCFENSLGGFDTVRCTGEAKTFPEYTPATATINDRESVYRVDKKDARSQNTGWLSKEAAIWLQDMFACRKTYRYDAGEWSPVILDENPTAETSTREDLTAFEFTYRTAITDSGVVLKRLEDSVSATWSDFINVYEGVYSADADDYIYYTSDTDVAYRLTITERRLNITETYNLLEPFPEFLLITADIWRKLTQSQRIARIGAFKNHIKNIEYVDIENIFTNSIYRPSSVVPGELAEEWFLSSGVWNDGGIWNDSKYWPFDN
jgi:hypothetical protein